MTGRIFDFEEPNEGLIWIPLAARRSLDHAGIKLSLEAWRSLDLAARQRLIEAGSSDAVATDLVDELTAQVRPTPERVAPRPDPTTIPEELSVAAGEHAPWLEAAWPRLDPLERYVLWKLASGGRARPGERSERFEAACRALLGEKSQGLSHLTERGDAHMVDISAKNVTRREAVARSFLGMKPETVAALRSGRTPKGDVLAVARIAGIQAAKRTPELIPLCHAVALTGVEVELQPESEGVRITATARAADRTGVEMEALVAASVAALALYDMLKSIDRDMTVSEVALVRKSGGRSGDYTRGPG